MSKSISLFISFCIGVSVTALHAVAADAPADYQTQIDAWRAKRVERLEAPDGWLSLIGLHWLKDGRNSVGAAKDNDIVLAAGPAHVGVVTLAAGKISIVLNQRATATINGRHDSEAELLDDSHEKPTAVAFGSVSFYAIDRDGRKGLRVKDSAAATRTNFLGIDYFPIDPAWRVAARFEPFDPPHTLEIPTVIGTIDKMTVPGKITFERDGQHFELLPVLEDPDAKELWLIFADRTSGKRTYGAGRFLYIDLPDKDGALTIDFNKAYNPPCAFTPHATCPLAPPENRLDLAVSAGEMKYRGRHE